MATPPSVIIQVGANASGVTSAIQQAAQRAQNILTRNPIRINSKNFGNFKGLSADADQFSKSLTRMSAVIQTFGQSAAILFGIQNAFVGLIKSTIDVEKQIASIGVVFGKSGKALEDFSDGIFDVAKNTGQSFSIVAKAAEEFARQGLGAEETLKRTNDAMILVRTTGLNVDAAVEALTATFNTFKGEVADTTKIVNTFRNVDTGFAVSAADLAEGIKRAGATAVDAKVSFNELNALITTLKQNTGRSGSVIGNSLKSIFTNLQNSDTLETLQSIGVSTLDLAGNIRPAVEILTQFANKIQNLSDVQAAQVKSTVAGKFQINSLNALLQDLSSSYSDYSQVLEVATNTTNEAEVSNEQLNKTLAATLNAAQQNLTNFSAKVGAITFAPLLKQLVGGFNSLFADNGESKKQGEDYGTGIGIGILQGIGSVIAGPGLIVAFAALFKISRLVLAGAASQLKSVLSLSVQNERVLAVQNNVLGVMQSQDAAIVAALAKTRTRQEYEAVVLAIIREQNAALALQQSVSRGIAVGAVGRRTFAGGYVPSFASEQMMINRGVGGAPGSARPVTVRNFNLGNGKRETVTANSSEYIVPNFDSSGGSAIYNRDMIKNFGLPSNAKKIYAGGYVPNLAADPLKQAVGREIVALKGLGFSGRQAEDSIRVQGSRQLATPNNPAGLGVFNTLQGQTSIGKAINDHRGENIKKAGIPNLAPLPTTLPGYGPQRLRTAPSALQGGGNISAAVTRTNQLVSVATRDLLRYSENLANSARFISQNRANFRNAEQLLTRFSETQRSVFSTLKGRAINNDAAATNALPTVLGRARDNANYRNSFEEERNRRRNILTEDRRRQAEAAALKKEETRNARAARLQTGLIAGSFLVPLLAGQAAGQNKDPDKQNLITGIGSGVGSGLLLASLFGGPAGILAGLGIAGAQVGSSYSKFGRSKALGLGENRTALEGVSERRQINSASGNEFQRLLESRDDARVKGDTTTLGDIQNKLSELIEEFKDEDLTKAAAEILKSGKPLEEVRVDFAKLLRSSDKRDSAEEKNRKLLQFIGEKAEENASSIQDFLDGGSGKGFRGLNLSSQQTKDFAKQLVGSLDFKNLPTDFSVRAAQASEVPVAADQFKILENLPNKEITERLKQVGAITSVLQTAFIEEYKLAAERVKLANSTAEANKVEIDLVASSKEIINANRRYISERRRAQSSAFDLGISKAQESLNNPSVRGYARTLGEGAISRAQIRQNTLDALSNVLEEASEFIQDKLRVNNGAEGANIPEVIANFARGQVEGDPLTVVSEALKNLTIQNQDDKITQDKLLNELVKIKQVNDGELKKLVEIEKIQRNISLKTQATEVSKIFGDKDSFKNSNSAFTNLLNIINPKKLQGLNDRAYGAQRFVGSQTAGFGPAGGRQDGINLTKGRGEFAKAFLSNQEELSNLGIGDFNRNFGLNQRLSSASSPEEFEKVLKEYSLAVKFEAERISGFTKDRARSNIIDRSVETLDAFRSSSAGRNVGQSKALDNIQNIIKSGNETSISAIPDLINQLKANVGRGGNLTTEQQASGIAQLESLQKQLFASLSILSNPEKLNTIAQADAEAITGSVPLELQKLNELVISSNSQLTSLQEISASAKSITELLNPTQVSGKGVSTAIQLDQESLDKMKAITENISAKVENFIQFDITGAVSIDGTDKETIKTQLEPYIRTIVTDIINKDRIMNGNKTPVKTTR